jgi:hypothetical protein
VKLVQFSLRRLGGASRGLPFHGRRATSGDKEDEGEPTPKRNPFHCDG